jgi:glycosyltransferase involved in cell wall biosynthesis
MKIKYIANIRIPTEKAHGYQICKMCEEFSRLGLEVELIVPKRKNHIKTDIVSFYDLKEEFVVKTLGFFDWLSLEKYFKNPFWFRLNTLFFYLRVFFIKIPKEAIVYTRCPELAWFLSLRKIKVIFEAHILTVEFIKRKMKYLLKAEKIVTISQGLKNKLVEKNIKAKNILVSPSGVDLGNFDIEISQEEARKKLNLDKNLKIIAYTGSFKTMGLDKGISLILEAMKELKKIDKILFLAVGGNSKDLDYYKIKAKEKGVLKNVLLLPRVNVKELAFYQKVADILLMPYPSKAHYSKDMSPLKMFEYMAGKRPIIASDLPSIREVLNKENCLFHRSDDAHDLAKKIKYLLANKEMADRLAKQSFLDVKKYTWQKRAENIINFIRK